MKSRLTKELLAKTSLELFKEQGYDNVSVQDICDHLEITKPTFYRFVPGKEALISLYYEGADDHLRQQMAAYDIDGNYVEEAWVAFSCVIVRSKEIGHDLYTRYISNCLRVGHFFNEIAFRLEPEITEALKKAQLAGQISNLSNPTDLFKTLTQTCFGEGCCWGFGSGEFDPLESFRKKFDIILRTNTQTA